MALPKPPPFVLVAGLPSGGTSAIAGVLHHLGVNMLSGRASINAKGRWYKTFEDPYFFRSVLDRVHPYGRQPKLATRDALLGLANYVADRRSRSSCTTPLGLKAWWQWASNNSGFEAWRAEENIKIVYVRRPLAETAQSYLGYERRAGRPLEGPAEDAFLKYLADLDKWNRMLDPDVSFDFIDLRSWDRNHFNGFVDRLERACDFKAVNIEAAFNHITAPPTLRVAKG